MASTKGVKKRREERIRSIVERQQAAESPPERPPAAPDAAQPPAFAGTPVGDGAAPSARAPFPATRYAGEEPDPETEWRRKSRDWLRAGAPHAGGPGDLRGSASASEPPKPPGGGMAAGFFRKLAISACLFGAVWGLFQVELPGTEPVKSFVLRALTEETDTEAIAAWYRSTFSGAPSFIPIFDQDKGETQSVDSAVRTPLLAPLAGGAVVRTFAETLGGVEIAGAPGAPVGAAGTGRVTHVSGDAAGGFTVVVQHAEKRVTLYGRLAETNVAPGDWVEAGDRIGSIGEAEAGRESMFYFAVKADGRYVDPMELVAFD